MLSALTSRLHLTSPAPTLAKRLSNALQLRAERAALRALSDDALLDIGLTRAEANSEAERPIWDAPQHWHTKT